MSTLVTRPWRITAVLLVVMVVVLAVIAQRTGAVERFVENRRCCQLSPVRSAQVALAELAGDTEYPSEIGQDKWVLEKVFPGVRDGYFVDVGSGHGTIGSNSLALERRGWKGICIDPFPVHMEGRSCELFKEVVFSEAGRTMDFHTAGGLGGVADTLGAWSTKASQAPVVKMTTVTMGDILKRASAPSFINYISMDIEGAELEALKAFPFDQYRVGSWTIEHNREEPKRSQIVALLESHGYRRVHEWQQDDFFVPTDARY